MSLRSFLKKPIVFTALLIIKSIIIINLTDSFYLERATGDTTDMTRNFFIWITILAIELCLTSFLIIKIFHSSLTKKQIKEMIYYQAIYSFTSYIIVPIFFVAVFIKNLISPAAAKETLVILKNNFGIFIDNNLLQAFQQSKITISQTILVTLGFGILSTIICVFLFYFTLRISNKIASYFVSNPEEVS